MENENFTVREMASYLRIGTTKAYQMLKEPGFPVVRFGKLYVIPRAELDKWVAQQAGKGR